MIKRIIYKVGQYLTCVYSNYAEWIISLIFIALFLLTCTLAHCETIKDGVVNYDTIMKEYAPQVKKAKAKSVVYAIAYYGVAASLITVGVYDMSENTLPSYICGSPFVLAGCAMIVIKF